MPNGLRDATLGERVGTIRCRRNQIESMRYFHIYILLMVVSIAFYTCTESEFSKGERLAKIYCASCHLFPEPALLDKKSWAKSVMPEMAFRMGLDFDKMFKMSESNRHAALQAMPGKSLLTKEEFDLIKAYYQASAPDSLSLYVSFTEPLQQFESTLWNADSLLSPNISMLVADTLSNTIWIGNRANKLFHFKNDLSLLDTFNLTSPPSTIQFKPSSDPFLLTMGTMDPNDLSNGSLVVFQHDGATKSIIDSLNRPVSFETADLNNDGLEDYIICAFGNYTGALLVYENLGGNNFNKHIINNLPGARKVVIKDFDNNGLLDIVALITQGDEQIQLFINGGKFDFRLVTLLRFPPVYGSSYFELADMNGDGKQDIIYSNGDNADYSKVLKPYHGIRIYMSKGGYEFEHAFFFSVNGASQTVVDDFDKDGDKDIAVISFFPDFNKPENGFLYLENQNNKFSFKVYSTPLAASARWLRMESLDLDGDKDQDILVSALNFSDGVPKSLTRKWKSENGAVMVLRNKGR